MEIAFSGTGIAIVGNWFRDGGKADIYLDGTLHRSIDTYYDFANQQHTEYIWHVLNLPQGDHKVRLVARLPLVLHHSDLRSKHIQIRPDGTVIGYLDWGSSETEDLPYFDVLHMIVHERKHEAGLTAAQAWRIVRERGELRDYEQRALDDYSERIGIDERARRAIEALYPVIVAGMAERNWDYSRPRWLARQFGI